MEGEIKDCTFGGQAKTAEAEIEALRETEARVLKALALLLSHGTESGRPDPRWMALAKTHIEQGFMCAMRAVGNPQRGVGHNLAGGIGAPLR